MKKLKLLPSILMLVLCVGVLAVGIYAVKPTKNQISGTITIGASNADVTMTVYKGSTTGTVLGSAVARAGTNLNIGALNFSMENVNTLDNVQDIVLVIVFTTSSNDNLVIETQNTESFDGIAQDDTVVNNMVTSTKNHTAGLTDSSTSLPAFNKENPYTITCTLSLNQLTTVELQTQFKTNFNIYKASEYSVYTTQEKDGTTYYTFGSFPQSELTQQLTLTDTHTNYMAYDDATGGVKYNDIYQDQNGNRYVKVDNVWEIVDNQYLQTENTKYYKIEPLTWRELTTSDGTATLMCENIVEQVAFQNEYYYDEGKEYHTERSRYYVKGQDGKPMLNTDTIEDTTDYVYANNYKWSDLRQYLNHTFYKSAFNSLEMTLIQKDTVNNGAETTESTTNPYACPNTTDHVFALSYQELISAGYNFATDESFTTTRMLASTAYSTATGTDTYSLEFYSMIAETYECSVVELFELICEVHLYLQFPLQNINQ